MFDSLDRIHAHRNIYWRKIDFIIKLLADKIELSDEYVFNTESNERKTYGTLHLQIFLSILHKYKK